MFLDSRSDDLATIQDRIYDQLLPLDIGAPVALLRIAVRQEDFVRVMSQNPSRRLSGDGAVDSVTAQEAAVFCERLGWILGRAVRLPSAMEMHAASQQAAVGFSGVNDEFEEWLRFEGTGETVPVWTAAGRQLLAAAPATRSRERGFRIVVEVDLLETATP
jgi:hypothetical protein